MVTNCCVYKCNNRKEKNSPFSFHCFPRDPEYFQQWVNRLCTNRKTDEEKPWQPKKNDRVCSEHFLESDFENEDLEKRYINKRLKREAVPTLFKNFPSHKQKGKKRQALTVRLEEDTVGEIVATPFKSNTSTAGTQSESEHSYAHVCIETAIEETEKWRKEARHQGNHYENGSLKREAVPTALIINFPSHKEKGKKRKALTVRHEEDSVGEIVAKRPKASTSAAGTHSESEHLYSHVCIETVLEETKNWPNVARHEIKQNENGPLKSDAVPTLFKNCPSDNQGNKGKKREAFAVRHEEDSVGEILAKRSNASTSISGTHFVFEQLYAHVCIKTALEETKKWLKEARQSLLQTRKERKLLSTQLRHQDIKLPKLLEDLLELRLLKENQFDLLNSNFTEDTMTLMENELRASGKPSNTFKYSEDLKAFAVTVHFYSSKAYEYLRKYLHLPAASTIRQWASSINCDPGFLTQVLDFLKVGRETGHFARDVILIFDSMSLKKEEVFDPQNCSYSGYANHGSLQMEFCETLASEALVLMAVGAMSYWKQPIGYFLVDKISSDLQTQIVRDGICLLSERGYNVVAVVCDGSYANQATAQLLGCSLTSSSINNTFMSPVDKEQRIPFVFDVCNLLKNVRNCLADLKILFKDGNQIRWEFIIQLDEIQLTDYLVLRNKTKTKHINCRNKLNVNVAVPTLSASVAAAIDFLREDLKLPQFQGSEETCAFVRMFDELFDLQLSWRTWQRFKKSSQSPKFK